MGKGNIEGSIGGVEHEVEVEGSFQMMDKEAVEVAQIGDFNHESIVRYLRVVNCDHRTYFHKTNMICKPKWKVLSHTKY